MNLDPQQDFKASVDLYICKIFTYPQEVAKNVGKYKSDDPTENELPLIGSIVVFYKILFSSWVKT